MGDGAAALGAEDAVDGLAGGALARPGLGGAVDGELVLGDDGDEGWEEGVRSVFVPGLGSWSRPPAEGYSQ